MGRNSHSHCHHTASFTGRRLESYFTLSSCNQQHHEVQRESGRSKTTSPTTMPHDWAALWLSEWCMCVCERKSVCVCVSAAYCLHYRKMGFHEKLADTHFRLAENVPAVCQKKKGRFSHRKFTSNLKKNTKQTSMYCLHQPTLAEVSAIVRSCDASFAKIGRG